MTNWFVQGVQKCKPCHQSVITIIRLLCTALQNIVSITSQALKLLHSWLSFVTELLLLEESCIKQVI